MDVNQKALGFMDVRTMMGDIAAMRHVKMYHHAIPVQ